jgi:hypothetical protein
VPRLEWGSGNSWPSASCPAVSKNVVGDSKSCQPLPEEYDSIGTIYKYIYIYIFIIMFLNINIYIYK